MNQPETPFESVSLALNQFRERRLADRRFSARDSGDRRMLPGEAPLGDDHLQDMQRKRADIKSHRVANEAAVDQGKLLNVQAPEAN